MIDEKKLIKDLIPMLNQYGDMDFAGKVIELINNQPKIGEWILCSKRLPEVQNNLSDEDCPEFNVIIKEASEATTLQCDAAGNWFDTNMNFYNVIAWQHLPEYKEGNIFDHSE